MRAISLLILGLILLPLAACSDDDYGDSGETVVTTAAASPTAAASGFELPDSDVSGTLSTLFTFAAAEGAITPSAADMPFPPDSVVVKWFQQDGLYVAYFEGFPTEEALCVTTWIEVDQEVLYSANSPTALGGCAAEITQHQGATGVHRCEGGVVTFLTEIPVAANGVLFANARHLIEDRIDGLEGSVASDIANTPEIDLSPCIAPTG